MSWFSKNILDPFEAQLKSAFEPGSPAAAAVTPQLQSLKDAGEQITTTVAEAGANAALATIPGGPVFAGMADEIIPLIIAALFNKASPAAQATVATQIALAPAPSATPSVAPPAASVAPPAPGVGAPHPVAPPVPSAPLVATPEAEPGGVVGNFSFDGPAPSDNEVAPAEPAAEPALEPNPHYPAG